MRIQGRKHPLHCSGDEIVITRLVLIHVILPDQLQGFCENGNLRVAVILFSLWWLHFLRESARDSAEKDASQQRNDHDPPHVLPTIGQARQSLMRRFWQRPTRSVVCSETPM